MISKNQKISIVTPSLNSAKYIEDCIKSVLNQNYKNFEHIIIDGGSADGTIGILKKYDHLKWNSEPDKGQSDALNKGFKRAEGEIIGWLNADEIYLPQTFSIVQEAFMKNNPDVCYGEIYFGDEKINLIRRKYDHPFDKNTFLYTDCIISSAAVFFSKKIFEKNNYLDVNFKAAMDYEFFSRLVFKNFRFFFIPKPLSVFRLTGESYGQKYEEFWKLEIRKTKEKYTKLPLKGTIFFPLISAFIKYVFWIKRLLLKIKFYGFPVIFHSRYNVKV